MLDGILNASSTHFNTSFLELAKDGICPIVTNASKIFANYPPNQVNNSVLQQYDWTFAGGIMGMLTTIFIHVCLSRLNVGVR